MLSADAHRRSSLVLRASLAGAVLVIGSRLVLGERSLTTTGPRAWLDTAFSLTLALIVLSTAAGIGQRVLRHCLETRSLLNRTLWSAPLGLGILAYAVLALGLMGLLRPVVLAAMLIAAAWWSRRAAQEWLMEVGSALARVPQAWQLARWPKRLFLLAGLLILLLALLQALMPPYDYDGLMYHLQGPRLFLQAGSIYTLPDNWQANGPATLDMIFLLGLAFGSDTFAKLMHLTCGVLLAMAVFSFGQQYLRPNGGWFAAAILISIPIFPIWSSIAYTDMAWALFEFLGLYAVILWRDQRQKEWLLAGGLFMGLALGSKYLALGTTAVLCLWVIWQSRSKRAAVIVQNVLRFAGTALLVSSPWYLKNWLMTGNPVYPFLFGGVGWDRTRLEGLMAWLLSFGNGRTVWDFLRLPLDVYMRRGNFTGFMGAIEWPSPLFPLGAFHALIRRKPQLNTVGAVVFCQCVLWALGSQQIRFLLPAFAGLSLLASGVALHVLQVASVRRWSFALTLGIGGTFLGAAVVIALMYAQGSRPWSVIAGVESKDAFLRRMNDTYAAQQFIRARLDPQARVLMMWDGRGYYCDARCLPDTAQSQWTDLVESTGDTRSAAMELRSRGVTHLLLSLADAAFVAQRDRTGRQQRALDFFLQEFQPACTRTLYQDTGAKVYEVACE